MITNLKLLTQLKSSKEELTFFSKSFVLTIIGKPGSGKTSVVQEILLNEELLQNKFDYIFIFSPTPLPYIECVENENWIRDFSLEKIFFIIETLNGIDIEEFKNVLFIFDDLVGGMHKESGNEKLSRLFFNRRHLLKNASLSYVVITQRYIAIPTNIRSCISHLIFFRLTQRDYHSLKHDLVGYVDFAIIAKSITNDYDFICMALDNGLIYKNFSERIII